VYESRMLSQLCKIAKGDEGAIMSLFNTGFCILLFIVIKCMYLVEIHIMFHLEPKITRLKRIVDDALCVKSDKKETIILVAQ
jgi:hypothetical protein